MYSYIDICFLQVLIEGKHDEAGVAVEREDGQDDEEHDKVDRLMKHRPEAQPGEPSCQIIARESRPVSIVTYQGPLREQ